MNLSIRHWLKEHQINLAQLDQSGSAGVAFSIAQEMELKSLTVFDISVLAEVLSLPRVVGGLVIQALARLTGSLLRQLSHKKPLKRNEGTWLAFQIAYLNGLQGLLEQEESLRKPWVNRALELGEQEINDPQLSELLKSLSPGGLSDSQAEIALEMMASSELIQLFSTATRAWLVANGAEETEAMLLSQRLNHGLPGHLLATIALHSLSLPQLQKFVGLGNTASLTETLMTSYDDESLQSPLPAGTPTIDLSRERYRASLSVGLSEPFFEESFALKDLYVPPKGIAKEAFGNNEPPNPQAAVDLMEWAFEQLKEKNSFAVIEAPPGYGKTSFCQIWAAKVAVEFYPTWMPLLVRLRDVTLGYTLEETLEYALPQANFTCADGWLSPVVPPCLLILDGLDELPRSPLAEDSLWLLFDQLLRFQSRYIDPRTQKPRHKIVLTCRTGTFDGGDLFGGTSLQTLIEARLRRIEIQPMGQDQLRKWFQNWSKLQSKNIAQAYFDFLKRGRLFRRDPAAQSQRDHRGHVELKAMVHQPLMLYLLGVLHRDGLLDEVILKMSYPQVKFEINDRLVTWLLGEPTAGLSTPFRNSTIMQTGLAHAGRDKEAIANLLKETSPQQLRGQMQVAALTILQTGHGWTDLNPTSGEVLPAFYFRSVSRDWPTSESEDALSWVPRQSMGTRVEFSHPILGEYLCAEQIARELKSLTSIVRNSYGEPTFVINALALFAQHLYNLLGYGILPMQMEELVAERLWREEQRDPGRFRFHTLFERLYNFYRSYCRGRWLDEGLAHKTRTHFQKLGNPLNALQIDAAVGLNVFLLLCACRREAQIPFSPCGNPIPTPIGQSNHSREQVPFEFNPTQLLVLARRTAVLSPTVFWQRVRHSLKELNLRGAYLNRAMLAGGNLEQCDLESAVLIEANLANANLKATNLSWANLTGANLSGANLSGTNLEGTNLTAANLGRTNIESTNLTNACLFQAQMDAKTATLAKAKGAFLSRSEYQAYSQAFGSQSIKDSSPFLTYTHSPEPETSVIEMAEDEPIVYTQVTSTTEATAIYDRDDEQKNVDTVVLESKSDLDNY